jgi:molybdenum cofactor guanylyltransferase
MSDAPPCGLILAGGRGQRLGGRDKGLVALQGRPLIAHIAERLAPQVGAMLISANRNAADYAPYGTVIADSVPGQPGPLAGLLAGLDHCPGDWLLAVPCDALGLPLDLGRQLARAASAAGVKAAYAQIGDDALYPCCLLHRDLQPALDAWLRGGQRAVRHWLHAEGAIAVPLRGWRADMFNLNTEADLARATRRLDPGRSEGKSGGGCGGRSGGGSDPAAD